MLGLWSPLQMSFMTDLARKDKDLKRKKKEHEVLMKSDKEATPEQLRKLIKIEDKIRKKKEAIKRGVWK